MLCKMAIEDMTELEGLGVHLNPSEVIRLNALGLRVERSATAGDILAAPRVGWAGDTPIYEPTIQSESWVDTYAQRWFGNDEDNFFWASAFAFAHARDIGFFQRQELQTLEGAVVEIREWHQSLTCTKSQLIYALIYARLGDDPTQGEYPEPKEEEAEIEEEQTTAEDVREYAIQETIAAGLGISVEEIKTLTQTRLYAILRAYHRNQGVQSKQANLQAHADYIRTLIAIKKAHGIEE